MPSSSVCWGIEIGAAAIKGVKLELDGSKVVLRDYAIVDHPKVLSTPGVEVNDVLRVSLGTLVSQYDLSKASIVVSVPGHSSFARFAKLPPVEPKKVPDIVKFEAMQQIPFPLEQVEWDYQTFVSPDSPDVEVGIFAITRDRIMERLAMLGDVGITPDAVTLSPIADFNALAYDLEFTSSTPGTVIVDVGTTSTDLIVSEAGRMWVRTFPIGGHQFTEALVSAFKISYAKAEKLKREAEDSPHARQIFQAMRPVFADLGQDIQRSIGYYQSLHKDTNLTRLIGLGSTFLLPGLRKYLKQQLSIETYRVEQFKRVGTEAFKNPDRLKVFQDNAIALTTAYGLAIQGLGLNAINCNLMPVPVLRTTMWREKVRWFGLAAGLAVAAGAAMFIRPVMLYSAVTSKLPSPQIDQAVRQAEDYKREATEAGVVGSPAGEYSAANMAVLLEGRGIYNRLVGDVGAMLEDASAKAPSVIPSGNHGSPERPVFSLKKFDTVYVPPKGADAAAPDGSGKPVVEVEMVVSTIQPDNKTAQELVLLTLVPWLQANKSRQGMPYQFIIPDQVWAQQGVPRPVGPDARGGSGSSGGSGGPPRGAAAERGAATGDATSLAPVSALRPAAAAVSGQEVNFVLKWKVEIGPPPPPPEQPAAQSEAAPEGGA